MTRWPKLTSHHRAMCHDEEIYKSPDVFDPDRFMKGDSIDTSVRDPRQMIFGFGRR